MTLRVDRVEKADGAPVDLTGQSAAKAYANYNGNTSLVRDSFNISSVTDSGTGRPTFNLTSAMASSGYVPVPGVSNWIGANAVRVVEIDSDTDLSPTTVPLMTTYLNTTNNRTFDDEEYVTLSVDGDLA